MMSDSTIALQAERRILLIRSQRVMLDYDLAELYGVETRALKQAVKRNLDRFPADFLFELTKNEVEEMVSQNVIPGWGKLGGALPFACTEQGVAMLSSVLRSKRAVQVNIAIMRAFVWLRELLSTHADLLFQLTDEELQTTLFKEKSVQRGLLKSYIFIAIELKGSDYARGKFSA